MTQFSFEYPWLSAPPLSPPLCVPAPLLSHSVTAVLHLSSPVLSPACRPLLLLLSIFAHDFSFYLEGYFIDHLFSSAQSLDIWDIADLMDIIHLGPDFPSDPCRGIPGTPGGAGRVPPGRDRPNRRRDGAGGRSICRGAAVVSGVDERAA